jgi:hypothetical protein
VPRKKIGLYIALQILGVAVAVTISQTIAAIGFPVLIIALIPLRTFLMPRWFSTHELSVLDALTANNKTVLASLGGRPAKMDEYNEDASEDEIGRAEEAGGGADGQQSDIQRRRSRSAVRQRMGSITRATAHKIGSHSLEEGTR